MLSPTGSSESMFICNQIHNYVSHSLPKRANRKFLTYRGSTIELPIQLGDCLASHFCLPRKSRDRLVRKFNSLLWKIAYISISCPIENGYVFQAPVGDAMGINISLWHLYLYVHPCRAKRHIQAPCVGAFLGKVRGTQSHPSWDEIKNIIHSMVAQS